MIKNLQHTSTAVADAKQCREPVGKRHNTSTVSDFYNIHSRILWIYTQGNHKGLHVAVQYFNSGSRPERNVILFAIFTGNYARLS